MFDPIANFANIGRTAAGQVPYPTQYDHVIARLVISGYTLGWDHEKAKTLFNFLVSNDCFDLDSSTTRSRVLELFYGDRPGEVATRIHQLGVGRNPSDSNLLELSRLKKEVWTMQQGIKGALKSITCYLRKVRLAIHIFKAEAVDGSLSQRLGIVESKYCFPIQEASCDEAIQKAGNIIRLATARRRDLQSVRTLV